VHPRFVEHGFTYHYLTSVTVAATVRLGLSPIVALPLHSFVFSVALLLALYAFARRVLGGPGRAAFAIVLFLLGGGWGWWLSIRAALSSGPASAACSRIRGTEPPRRPRTSGGRNLYFSLIAPQRAYLYGLPLGLLALRLLWSGIESGRISRFAFAGVVAGLLPLAHQGTLLSLALITPFLFLLFPSRRWFAFFGLWALVGVPQVFAHACGAGSIARVPLPPGMDRLTRFVGVVLAQEPGTAAAARGRGAALAGHARAPGSPLRVGAHAGVRDCEPVRVPALGLGQHEDPDVFGSSGSRCSRRRCSPGHGRPGAARSRAECSHSRSSRCCCRACS
jgi:hypothetical protein